MQSLPIYIPIIFLLGTLYAVVMFWKATGYSRGFIIVLSLWLAAQGIIAYSGFYADASGLPPRFVLAVWPALIAIITLFVTKRGGKFIDELHLPTLTLLHFVRIPVEIVLLWLAINKVVPYAITFEGTNFDIFSGITAPILWFLSYRNKNQKLLLVWNIICLILLINVVTTAILAAPFRFQQLAFDQPTIAVLYFPYIWLPAVIVPLVLLSHLASIRKLVTGGTLVKNKIEMA